MSDTGDQNPRDDAETEETDASAEVAQADAEAALSAEDEASEIDPADEDADEDEADEVANAGDGPSFPDAKTPEDVIADMKDQLLRALAETENVRRRSAREKEDAARYSIANFARDMLNVSDNMHRALEAVPEELRNEEGPVAALFQGVEMTERELHSALERHGIKLIEPMGEKFDHNLHQAMFELPDGSVAPGTVVQVMQAGYVIGDRLLRPAMVGVAKAGEAPASDENGADEGSADGGVDTST